MSYLITDSRLMIKTGWAWHGKFPQASRHNNRVKVQLSEIACFGTRGQRCPFQNILREPRSRQQDIIRRRVSIALVA